MKAKDLALEILAQVEEIKSNIVADVAVNLLQETMKNPGPPRPPENIYAKGRLMRSGAVYVGSKLIATTGVGPSPKHYDVDEPEDTITLVYSTPKPAGLKAKVFYVANGSRWFDYAPFQHMRNKLRAFWVDKVMLNEVKVNKIIEDALDRHFK